MNKLGKALDLLLGNCTLRPRLIKALNIKRDTLDSWMLEAREVSREIQKARKRITTVFPWLDSMLGMHSPLRGESLYVLYRAIRPVVIVETGVCSGVSSLFALRAIQQNKVGRLVSLDLPDKESREIPSGKGVGWMVPDDLKKNWDLRLGPSQEILPLLCRDLDSIDVFLHDSLHTFDHMLWEFRTVWPKIKSKGFVASDDICMNNAFNVFVAEVHAPYFKTYHRFGWICKT